MANKLLLKKSSVANKVPLATDLDYGELAINYSDGKLYYKSSNDSINFFPSTVSGVVQSVDSNTGDVTATQLLTAIKKVDGSTSGLDSDLLDGQEGSYYLDWTNTTNKPDPTITVTLTGDVTGTANTTLTDLASGTISIVTVVAENSVALGTDTTGNYVASITNGSYITGANGGSESAALTLSVDATSTNTASKVVARDASGNFAASTVSVTALSIDGNLQDYATTTTTATTQTALVSFATASYGSGEIMIQATQGTTRQISKLLIVHNGTTADATEYGSIQTGTKLFTVDVDINSGNVRVLVTPTSATSTVFKATYSLIGA